MVTALRLQGKDGEALVAERDQAKIRERNERVNLLLRDRADKPNATAEEWFEIGSIFLDMQMESRAMYWFDKVLAREGTHPGVHRRLTEYYERNNEPEKAARAMHDLILGIFVAFDFFFGRFFGLATALLHKLLTHNVAECGARNSRLLPRA